MCLKHLFAEPSQAPFSTASALFQPSCKVYRHAASHLLTHPMLTTCSTWWSSVLVSHKHWFLHLSFMFNLTALKMEALAKADDNRRSPPLRPNRQPLSRV